MMRFRPLCFRLCSWLSLFASCVPALADAREPIEVVQASSASVAQRRATDELVARLRRLYPDERFVHAREVRPAARTIVVAELSASAALLGGLVDPAGLSRPESFAVSHRGDLAVIAGADARGVVYGIYALLETLGCGFFLSDESEPLPRRGTLSFEGWSPSDAPLFADRIILNWHNFLSSATTWEYEDWERYIATAVRLRFNDLMVHAYGNSPMFSFQFNSVAKTVGYFATTQRGRDWGTQHVNDVRRLVGGDVFSSAVFGASVAQVDSERRVEATVTMMRRVFAEARARGLGVTFALDVDTTSANPSEIIATLPADARFRSGEHELANPDTPAGFAFYRAQVEQLLTLYPDVTRLAVWFRDPTANTPWRRLKRAEMPAAWQREFTGPDEDVSAFALAKIVHAFRRALTELKRDDVALATGSWAFPFLTATDRYLAPEIPIIALDWWVSFDSARARRDFRAMRSGRKVIPILWTHHDDRTYVGRPYTPFRDLATKLEQIGAAGFGVIHWTTRPLDLYFRSTSRQTWRRTRDEPLELTCDDAAARLFGEAARKTGGRYLLPWVTEAPMFGRETTALHRFPAIDAGNPCTTRPRATGAARRNRNGAGAVGVASERTAPLLRRPRAIRAVVFCRASGCRAGERCAEARRFRAREGGNARRSTGAGHRRLRHCGARRRHHTGRKGADRLAQSALAAGCVVGPSGGGAGAGSLPFRRRAAGAARARRRSQHLLRRRAASLVEGRRSHDRSFEVTPHRDFR